MFVQRAFGRFIAASAMATAAVVGLGGTVQADTQTGQVGHYSFRDANLADASVVCVYTTSEPHRLTSIIARPPHLWWPDTDSSNNRQHGKVGWKATVRLSLPGAYGPWSKLKASTIHTARAYEDNPPYDLRDDAPFTKITFSFNAAKYASHPDAYISVRFAAFWYRRDGGIKGKVKHDAGYYQFRNTPGDGGTTACPIVIPAP